jgi:hypothetical protein
MKTTTPIHPISSGLGLFVMWTWEWVSEWVSEWGFFWSLFCFRLFAAFLLLLLLPGLLLSPPSLEWMEESTDGWLFFETASKGRKRQVLDTAAYHCC